MNRVEKIQLIRRSTNYTTNALSNTTTEIVGELKGRLEAVPTLNEGFSHFLICWKFDPDIINTGVGANLYVWADFETDKGLHRLEFMVRRILLDTGDVYAINRAGMRLFLDQRGRAVAIETEETSVA